MAALVFSGNFVGGQHLDRFLVVTSAEQDLVYSRHVSCVGWGRWQSDRSCDAGLRIDFVSLHWQGRYFPAFNIADSAITLGAIALGVDWIILEPLDSDTEK